MGTASDVLRIAAGEIGYSRWNDPQTGTKYGRWYAALTNSPYFGTNGVPFCAMGASWTFSQAGVTCAGFPGAYTPTMLQAAKNAGKVLGSKYNAQPGDVVYFNWDGGVVDHVGFCERAYSGYMQTIEFNTNNGQVCRRTRNWSTIEAVVRPNYGATPAPKPSTPAPAPKPEPVKVEDVKPIYNNGGEIYRMYNQNGAHFYCTKAEADSLKAPWKNEGVAFKAPKGGTQAVYRLYDKKSGQHLFTTSFGEAHSLEEKGWVYENTPFFANTSGTPIYRLYNKNDGDHLLTKSKDERDSLIKKGWQDENIAFYV